MESKLSLMLLIALFFFTNCGLQPDKVEPPIVEEKNPKLIEDFEKALTGLNKTAIASLDEATALFQRYVLMAKDFNQKDSLFMPYFNYYNIGRQLLINESEDIISKYGFAKKLNNGKTSLVPIRSNYLETKIIGHLSPAMQSFCTQQLKEFEDQQKLEVVAANTIWWENFNHKNPNFFLKAMTDYHYKNWHLQNLLKGTNTILVFNAKNKLSSEANSIYNDFILNHSVSETGKIIKRYLDLLEKNGMIKTAEVDNFLNTLN